MKRIFTLFVNLIIATNSFGQDNSSKNYAIYEEGKKLYRSEMASWYGTDVFLEKFREKQADIGGYVSYTENNISKCVFVGKGEHPKVIGTVSFDHTYNIDSANIDSMVRELTANEFDLFAIRSKTLVEIDSDKLFKIYENTGLNVIPLIDNGEKKVYVLIGPKNTGEVILGNDFLLTFDSQNNLLSKKNLHANIITIKYSKETENGTSIHTHLPATGSFITPTDICTILLYEKFAKWKQHIVISDEHITFWDFESSSFSTISRKLWDEMYKKK